MNFTKTSQKFGQWSDPKVNSVYGLGFPTEAELNKVSIFPFDEPSMLWNSQTLSQTHSNAGH